MQGAWSKESGWRTGSVSLPGLLQLLDSALADVPTLEVELRDWTRPKPTLSARVERNTAEPDSPKVARLSGLGAGPFPRPTETTRKIWMASPDRLRVEVSRNGQVIGRAVRVGTRWWRWDVAGGTEAGEAASEDGVPAPPQALDPPLLTPMRLLGWLRLHDVAAGCRAGRAVLAARGSRRQRWTAGERRLRYELEFDAEHGTMLRLATYQGRQCVQLTEATGVVYGHDLDTELFVIPPVGLAETPPSVGRRSVNEPLSNRGLRLLTTLNGTALTVWLTGLPSSGKTTLAHAVKEELSRHGLRACVLDGDDIRAGLSSDLGYSRADRAEQARRVAHMAAMVAASGVVAIVALISPYAEDRNRARAIHRDKGALFIEVWVNTPVEICQARDSKGLYSDARAGRLNGLTGSGDPYEPPEAAEVQVSGISHSPQAAAAQIAELIFTNR